MNSLPKVLLEKLQRGEIVLFLGSGANIGAIHPEGKAPPTAAQLASKIANRFLGEKYKEYPLDQVAAYAISESDLITVQTYIAEIFTQFNPAEYHKIIPRIFWKAIFTTNYDTIIEKAYEDKDSIQNIAVFIKNGERIDQKLRSRNDLPLFKLHGCITNISDPKCPLILTTEQYITHRNGRSRLFDRLKELAYDYSFVFAGYSLRDSNVRTILHEMSGLQEALPRSYIIQPTLDDIETRFWESRRFTCITDTFEKFLRTVESEIPYEVRSIFVDVAKESDLPITRKVVGNKEVSKTVRNFLTTNVDYIHNGIKANQIDPKLFYKGFYNDFTPLIYNLDVKRRISDDFISEVILRENDNFYEEFILIKGHAGSGKTILAKRIAWDSSVEFDKICLYTKEPSVLEYDAIHEICILTQERIYLFVDAVTEHIKSIENILIRAKKDKIRISIIGIERNNEWNSYCDRLEPYVNNVYEVKYLSEEEIGRLCLLLKKHRSLGYMEKMTFDDQKKSLAKISGRQLLVALYEATLGKRFTEIIIDEYNSISLIEAKSLYLTVAVFHSFGIKTRAGLISRIHGIAFHKFKEKLFKPLEFIIFTYKDDLLRDYIYTTRHSSIAQILFENILRDREDKYDEIITIIRNLDIDYKTDHDAFYKLINNKRITEYFTDPQMGREIYHISHEVDPNNAYIFQQEALYEMHITDTNYKRAEYCLIKAYEIEPYNDTIAHSLAELEYKKSKSVKTALEKNKLRNKTIEICNKLIRRSHVSSYAYHTLLKVYLDVLEEAIEVGDPVGIERESRQFEKTVKEALQLFPDESFLLDIESTFQKIMNNNPQAILSLERAYANNKRSSYISSRLAKLYEMNDEFEKAIEVLRESADANPGDKSVNFNLAILLLKTKYQNQEEVLHYLRRSFTKGDKNYTAQFWYNRQLFCIGRYDESIEEFRSLAMVNLPTTVKDKPRGILDDRPYRGTIIKKEATYAFIKIEGLNVECFCHSSNVKDEIWSRLNEGNIVEFELCFNYKGPICINLRK